MGNMGLELITLTTGRGPPNIHKRWFHPQKFQLTKDPPRINDAMGPIFILRPLRPIPQIHETKTAIFWGRKKHNQNLAASYGG